MAISVNTTLSTRDIKNTSISLPRFPSDGMLSPETEQGLSAAPTNIQVVTAQITSAGVKYALSIVLPTFIINLWNKITSSSPLSSADHYAKEIAEKSAVLAAMYIQKMPSNLLVDQEASIEKIGETSIELSGQLLAGYVAHEGWNNINAVLNAILKQALGDGVVGKLMFVIQPLVHAVVGRLEADFEKRWDIVAGQGKSYAMDLSGILRGNITQTITAFNPAASLYVLSEVDAVIQKEKIQALNELKSVVLEFVQSDALSAVLGRFIAQGISRNQQSILGEVIQSFLPNAIAKSTVGKNLVKSMINHVALQFVEESNEVLGRNAPVDLLGDVSDILKQALNKHLATSQWNVLDRYMQSMMLDSAIEQQVLVKEIWNGLKPDILAYVQGKATSDNTIVQFLSSVRTLLAGYLQTFGWEVIDDMLEPVLVQEGPQDPITAMRANLQVSMSLRIKSEIELALGVVRPAPNTVNEVVSPFITEALNQLVGPMSRILNYPNVTNAIGPLLQTVFSATTTEPKIQLSLPTNTETENRIPTSNTVMGAYDQGGMINRMIGIVTTLLTTDKTQQSSGVFALASLSAQYLVKTGSTGLINFLTFYLGEQGVSTLDKYMLEQRPYNAQMALSVKQEKELQNASSISFQLIEQHAEQWKELAINQLMIGKIWGQAKGQLIRELFESETQFYASQSDAKVSSLSILTDEVIRSTLGVPSTRNLGKVQYATLGAAALTDMSWRATKAGTGKVFSTVQSIVGNLFGSLRRGWSGTNDSN